MVFLIQNLKHQILLQYVMQCLGKHLLFLCTLWRHLHPCNMILLFLHILVLHNHTKTHAFHLMHTFLLGQWTGLVMSLYVLFDSITYKLPDKFFFYVTVSFWHQIIPSCSGSYISLYFFCVVNSFSENWIIYQLEKYFFEIIFFSFDLRSVLI